MSFLNDLFFKKFGFSRWVIFVWETLITKYISMQVTSSSGSTIKPSFLWRVQVPKMFDEVAIASLTYLYFNGVFRRGVKKSGYFTVTKTVKYPFFLDASPKQPAQKAAVCLFCMTSSALRTEISAADLVSWLSSRLMSISHTALFLVKLLKITVAETEPAISSWLQNRSYNFAWFSSVPKKGVVPVSRLSSKPVPTQTSNTNRLAVAAAAERRDRLVHCCTCQTNQTKPNLTVKQSPF